MNTHKNNNEEFFILMGSLVKMVIGFLVLSLAISWITPFDYIGFLFSILGTMSFLFLHDVLFQPSTPSEILVFITAFGYMLIFNKEYVESIRRVRRDMIDERTYSNNNMQYSFA